MKSHKSLKRKHSDSITGSKRDYELHVKNPYFNNLPDFAALAAQFPHLLRDYVQINPVSKKGSIDFSNNDSLRGLSRALLLKDFRVDVEIPSDHLCPPLPNRINYLCWISDLLEGSVGERLSCAPNVLDIGVGPVCIYPILGHKLFGWKFVGSDVDGASVEICQRNIDNNPDIKEYIRVVCVPNSNTLQDIIAKEYLPGFANTKVLHNPSISAPLSEDQPSREPITLRNIQVSHGDVSTVLRGPVRAALYAIGGHYTQTLLQCEKDKYYSSNVVNTGDNHPNVGSSNIDNKDRLFDVVMCNPPFYDTDEEIQPNERTVCTGSASEMRTPGGEVAFISAIIYDSLLLKDRVLWYTSMVGKHSSLQPLRRLLAASGVPHSHCFFSTLTQGVTSRWVLAWTFSAEAAGGYKKWCVRSQADAVSCVDRDDGIDGGRDDGTGGNGAVDSELTSSYGGSAAAGNSEGNNSSDVATEVEAGNSALNFPRACQALKGLAGADVHSWYRISMPNSEMFETMLPTDHDVLFSGKYQYLFYVHHSGEEEKEKQPIVLDTLTYDCQDSISMLTAADFSIPFYAIGLTGVRLNAVTRVIAAIEDTNEALAKDALVYQFVLAVEVDSNSGIWSDGNNLMILYTAMSRDAVPVKAYDCMFQFSITGMDKEPITAATDTSEYSAQLVIHSECAVMNVTGAYEKWRSFADKFNDIMAANLWRKNRRWRRRLDALYLQPK